MDSWPNSWGNIDNCNESNDARYLNSLNMRDEDGDEDSNEREQEGKQIAGSSTGIAPPGLETAANVAAQHAESQNGADTTTHQYYPGFGYQTAHHMAPYDHPGAQAPLVHPNTGEYGPVLGHSTSMNGPVGMQHALTNHPGLQFAGVSANKKPMKLNWDTSNAQNPSLWSDDLSDSGLYRAVTKRSRMGCLTCRQRKKRCSETRPKCSECLRLGLDCIWPRPGMEHKNKAKDAKEEENTVDHEVYGKIKILRGIVEYKSK